MNAEERGREEKMIRGLREKIGQCAGVLQDTQDSRVYDAIKECRDIFDSMGGAEGPRDAAEYEEIFGEEPPAAVAVERGSVAVGADSYAAE